MLTVIIKDDLETSLFTYQPFYKASVFRSKKNKFEFLTVVGYK